MTDAPELRTTSTGINVCSFTVAVNRRKTANNDNPGADFFRVTVWRQLGENCARFLDKGKKVYVRGAVSVHTWESDSGKHGASLEVTAEDVEFLSPRVSDATPAETPTNNPVPGGFSRVETDELPF